MFFIREANMANTIKAEDVLQAYRGRTGCMCGCRGKYFEPESRGLAGVLRDVNARMDEATRIAPSRLNKGSIVAIDRDGKTLALYLRPGARVGFVPLYR